MRGGGAPRKPDGQVPSVSCAVSMYLGLIFSACLQLLCAEQNLDNLSQRRSSIALLFWATCGEGAEAFMTYLNTLYAHCMPSACVASLSVEPSCLLGCLLIASISQRLSWQARPSALVGNIVLWVVSRCISQTERQMKHGRTAQSMAGRPRISRDEANVDR